VPTLTPRLKLIYLTLQSNEWTDRDTALTPSPSPSTTRLLTIQTKFLIKNKTPNSLKLEFLSNNIPIPARQHFISLNDDNDALITSQAYASTGEVLNTSKAAAEESEEDLMRDRANDLFYLRVAEFANQTKTFQQQSKLAVLSLNEKALKQVSTPASTNDNVLISRQCFCLYSATKTLPIICVQKLLINKDGRLLISLKEDTNCLARVVNCLDEDVYVWPRISCNFIFENYVRNAELLSEKVVQQARKASPRRQNSGQNKVSQSRSLSFMHRIPARKCLRFNYDFIGTDQFPIENLGEQLFFMLACSGQRSVNRKIIIK
jgi:hypothetical protein